MSFTKGKKFFGAFFAILSLLFIFGLIFPESTSATSAGQIIADKAIELAWPDDNHHWQVKEEFKQAAIANGTPNFASATGSGAVHCAHFVSTVILASGVDSNFPKGGKAHTTKILPYLESSNLWEEIDKPNSVNELQPGDIVGYTANGNGHIFIYVGNGKFAEASYNNYSGRIASHNKWKDSKYHIFRIKDSAVSSPSLMAAGATGGLSKETLGLFAQNSIDIWCRSSGESDDGECVPPTGDQIIWIGDSYSVESRDKIQKALPGIDLGSEDKGNAYSPYSYIQYGKHLDWISNASRNDAAGGPSGVDILKEIVKDNKLRPYLVLALGTNDIVTEAETTKTLEDIANLVGDNTKVILTTAYTTNGNNYSPGNAAKKAFASSHDNFYVADWAAVAKPEYYANNSTHPDSNGGYDAWVDTIVKALPKNCNSGALPGDTIVEKIWNWFYNYFNEKGISSVDKSAVISGIIGNLMVESSLNPFAVGGGNYYGLQQYSGDYGGAEMRQKVNNAVGADYFSGSYPDSDDETEVDKVLKDKGISQDAIDKAIDIELQAIVDEDYWSSEFLPGLKSWGVADTPEGYSDLFLTTIERAVGWGDSIEDSGVLAHADNTGPHQAAEKRRNNAKYIYDKYASKAGSGNSQSKPNSVSSSPTTNSSSSGSSVSSVAWDSDGWITGGMEGYTKEAAPNLGTKYKSGKPNKILLHYTQGTTSGLAAYGSMSDKSVAAHFTIDLKKKEVSQHYPIGTPSGAVIDSDDVRDIVQIEIVGYGFEEQNPDSPGKDSKCIITGDGDHTNSEYCFANFSDEDWNYLAKLLVAISNWGKDNGTNIPLTTSVTWTGDVSKLRLSPGDFDSTTGIVAHMHAPDKGNHYDTGNIWPLVKAAIDRVQCNLDGDTNSISGAKNADKQATEVGRMWFSDTDTGSMKTLLENYGDLAYRTGQVYGIPWIAILVQGRYEDGALDPGSMCGSNNFWGIYCFGDHAGPGQGKNYSNLGEGFTGYGETVHNGYYEEALKYPDDPYKYEEALELTWIGTGNRYSLQASIKALEDYIATPEGQSVVAEFGAANCNDNDDSPYACGGGNNKNNNAKGNVAALQALVKEWAWPTSGPGSSSAQSAYTEAMKHASYVGGCGGQDCGAFVSNLIIESGWDPDFKSAPTWDQIDYLDGSDKWTNVTSQIKSNSDAQPGDVIICDVSKGDNCVGTTGHVLIYVGDIDGFSSKMASASLCGRWPEADAADDISYYVGNGYRIYRKTK